MTFASPYFFIFLLCLPLMIWYYRRRQHSRAISYPSISLSAKLPVTMRQRWRHLPFILVLLATTALIIALARPQHPQEDTKITVEGIDIVLAVDVSGSMYAEDFEKNGERVNRITIVKDAMTDFIHRRKNDRIGLVVFAKDAYTQSPMTIDYNVLDTFIERINIGMIDENGTAVGSGIMTALTRLEKSKAKSRIIILLTDGASNSGDTSPESAAQVAKSLGVKIYTIGAGQEGLVPMPVFDRQGNKRGYQRMQIDLDEPTLKKIAKISDGQFFRAKDSEALDKGYATIDKLEKTKIQSNVYFSYEELFHYFVIFALICLALEQVLCHTWLRSLP